MSIYFAAIDQIGTPIKNPEEYSDERMMNILVSNVENKEALFYSCTNLEAWPGVTMNASHVQSIEWNTEEIKIYGGFIDLGWLPRDIELVNLRGSEMKGVFDAKSIPRSLKHLDLSYCHFMGTIDWDLLPETLVYMSFELNEIEGTIDFSKMPPYIRYLNVYANWFSAIISCPHPSLDVIGLEDVVSLEEEQSLWDSLEHVKGKGCVVLRKNGPRRRLKFCTTYEDGRIYSIDWSNFALSGEIDFRCLPKSIKHVNLSNNKLRGTLFIDNLPREIETLSLRGNSFIDVECTASSFKGGIKCIDLRDNNLIQDSLFKLNASIPILCDRSTHVAAISDSFIWAAFTMLVICLLVAVIIFSA